MGIGGTKSDMHKTLNLWSSSLIIQQSNTDILWQQFKAVNLATGKQKNVILIQISKHLSYTQTKTQPHNIQPTPFPVILAKFFVRTFCSPLQYKEDTGS
jgi:hypothetical protein